MNEKTKMSIHRKRAKRLYRVVYIAMLPLAFYLLQQPSELIVEEVAKPLKHERERKIRNLHYDYFTGNEYKKMRQEILEEMISKEKEDDVDMGVSSFKKFLESTHGMLDLKADIYRNSYENELLTYKKSLDLLKKEVGFTKIAYTPVGIFIVNVTRILYNADEYFYNDSWSYYNKLKFIFIFITSTTLIVILYFSLWATLRLLWISSAIIYNYIMYGKTVKIDENRSDSN